MFHITRKEIKLFFNDKRAMMLSFLLPIALITLFAMAFGAIGGDEESSPIYLVVVDEDQSAFSKNFISTLDTTKSLSIEKMNFEDAQKEVKKGDAAALLVFHKGIEDSMHNGNALPIELQYDASREAEVGLLQQALISKLMSSMGASFFQQQAIQQFEWQFPMLDSATSVMIKKQIAEVLSSPLSLRRGAGGEVIKMTALVQDKDNAAGLVQAVAGNAMIVLLFSVAAMGAGILEEKEEGTLKKLLYSPIKPQQILFGKMFSAIIISILQLIVMFLFAWLAFGLDIFINIPSLIIMILATAFAVSGVGLFLASIARTRQQVQGLSSLIILTMSALGGSMVPLFIMPMFMQQLAKISLNYWSMQGFFDIFWRQLPTNDPVFLSRIAVLLLFGIVLTTVSMFLLRRNLMKIV